MSGRVVSRFGIVAAMAVASGASARGGAAPALEYVRDKPTIDATVRSALARAGSDSSVLFVFDTITFDPPPGRNEYMEQHRFAEDLPKWLECLADAAPAAPAPADATSAPPGVARRAVYAAATTSAGPVAVGGPKWEAQVRGELREAWWDAGAFDAFEPAHRCLPRLLAKTPGTKKTLVLVTGDLPPEKWCRRPFNADAWRRKLSDVGAYWDEEKVGAALADAGAALFVVAPESRFGDFLPFEDVPHAPWASRPSSLVAGIASMPNVPQTGVDLPGDAVAGESTRIGRFDSLTALWFPFQGMQKFFDADSPSAYGFWPYARAAAKAGGLYYLYPFPPADWLDACPRDSSLVDALAPELVPAGEFARLRAGDEALAAMLEAQRLVIDRTPWTDGSHGSDRGGAPTWCGFESPATPAAKWHSREKPWDWYLGDRRTVKDWKAESRKLAPVVESYDRAVAVLAAAEKKLADGTLAGTCRRSQANLRLARFWFEMSAFHLDALRIFVGELERFLPPGKDDRLVEITYTPVFRMSDVLDAYDGRTISLEDEKRYGHFDGSVGDVLPDLPGVRDLPGGKWRGYQGNFLVVPIRDPNYRARRDDDFVLFNLDSRLLPRALRIIDAGRDVMAHEARSGWGWVVYYSEPVTFICQPVPAGDGLGDRVGDGDVPLPGPSTPRSGGGGPGTPK